ncbi:MAG: flagellar type III secretion system pore protein FliP [Planctomycetota bacterium]
MSWRQACLCLGVMAALWIAPLAFSQQGDPTPMTPITPIEGLSTLLPQGDAVPGPGGRLDATLSILLLLTVLSLAPAILVMCTCFTRIIIVLALLRQALGTQSLPPSQIIVGLSLFMTFLVMAPTFSRINDTALQPYQAGDITQLQAWSNAKQPLRDFMFDQIEYTGNWDSVYMLLEYRGVDLSEPESLTRADVDMITLVPAFVLSELKVAFLMGFRLYLPFLVIDMVVSSVLISMGMLMLPPVFISLPFKLLLFVLVDGWDLVAGSLLHSFWVPGGPSG